jgi:hypothetical protein
MTRSALIFASLTYFVQLAFGCTQPVYRVAMDTWKPQQYIVTILYSGKLTHTDSAALYMLKPAASAHAAANVAANLVNIGNPGKRTAKLVKEHAAASMPWMILFFPETYGTGVIVSAPFNTANVSALLGTPLRDSLMSRIFRGDAAVWVLLQSGVEKNDRSALAILTSALSEMDVIVSPPDSPAHATAPASLQRSSQDANCRFSYLTLALDDPRDRMLAKILRSAVMDSLDPLVPALFAIFGRGRAMPPLTGNEITKDNIIQISGFLLGPCSCTISGMNPGFDILTDPTRTPNLIPSGPPVDNPLPSFSFLPQRAGSGAHDTPASTSPQKSQRENETAIGAGE